MTRATPGVTVLMAVHDGEPYLRAALDSVLAQTYADFELLVVDDGSADASRDIVRSYGDSRIRLLENGRNVGLARSLNRGFAAASAELVARLDADDVCEPDRLERQVAFLENHRDVALIGSAYHEIDEAGRVLRTRSLPTEHADLCWALLFYCPFVHSAVLMRKAAAYGTLRGYDETLAYSMDYELWRRLAQRFRVANLPAPLIRYRVTPTSMTATYGKRTLEGRAIAMAGLSDILDWEGPDVERRFALLQAVLKEPPLALNLEEIRWAVREAYRLDARFCPYFRLNAAECAIRSRALRRQVARRLAEMVRQFPHRYTLRAGARVLSAAAREEPRIVLSRAFAAAAGRLALTLRGPAQPRD